MAKRNYTKGLQVGFVGGYYNGVYDTCWEVAYLIEEQGITDVHKLYEILDKKAEELVEESKKLAKEIYE